MSKKLAIRGHSTRGNEVIKLLEMMGGSNVHNFTGCNDYAYYVIDGRQNIIRGSECISDNENIQHFTIEKFWEKYPIKIGDKVTDLKTGKIAEVYKMHWSENNSCVYYDIKYPNNCGCQRRLMDLKPVDDVNDIYSISECKTIEQGTYAIKIADGYKFDGIDENGNIIVKSINPKYPTTYDDCCNMLNADEFVKYELMINFPKLINARNAYWKIAGEQMGLCKPWGPDDDTEIYNIYRTKNTIHLGGACWGGNCNILEFPTEEMRDAFYENFKDLIEQCKELL